MKKTFTKQELTEFIGELQSMTNRYKRLKEECMPNGFWSSKDLAKKYDIVHRVGQRWIAESLSLGELEVKFVRIKNGLFVRKSPAYKFKSKKDEKSFKSRHKGK